MGGRFFDMGYPQVEQITGGRSKAFIAELTPQSPIYVPLLPEEVQWAIGQLHPVAELPFSMLQDEGFDADTHVDIFYGGPIVEARVAMLKTVAASSRMAVATGAGRGGPRRLVAVTRRQDYRALISDAPPGVLDADAMVLLGLAKGDAVRTAPLAIAEPDGSEE